MTTKSNLPAVQLATDFAKGVGDLSDAIVESVSQMNRADDFIPEQLRSRHHRQQACAAAWATSMAAIEESDLTKSDKDKFVPLVLHLVLPRWKPYFDSHDEMTEFLNTRPATFLERAERRDYVKTGAGIAYGLLRSIPVTAAELDMYSMIMTPMLSRFVMGSRQYFADVKQKFNLV